MHYHAYMNVAGYLPADSDSAAHVFGTFAEARDSLAEDLRLNIADEQATRHDPVLPEGSLNFHVADLEFLHNKLAALPDDCDQGWLGYAGTDLLSAHNVPTAYQVVRCTCTDNDDNDPGPECDDQGGMSETYSESPEAALYAAETAAEAAADYARRDG